MGMAVLGAVTALVVSLVRTAEPSTVSYTADPDAHPVTGSRTWTAPTDELVIREYDSKLIVDAYDSSGWDYVRVELRGAGGAPLQVGTYTDVRNFHFHPELVGAHIISGGLGTGETYDEFTIDTLERDPVTGRLTALDFDLTVHNDSPTGPEIAVSVHFEE